MCIILQQGREGTLAAKNKMGRPRRFTSQKEVVRVVLNLSKAENEAFRKAIAKVYPGATITNTFRILIEGVCKEAGVKWPK
jgi:hypothetical protein